MLIASIADPIAIFVFLTGVDIIRTVVRQIGSAVVVSIQGIQIAAVPTTITITVGLIGVGYRWAIVNIPANAIPICIIVGIVRKLIASVA
jgi:hypothetical protein